MLEKLFQTTSVPSFVWERGSRRLHPVSQGFSPEAQKGLVELILGQTELKDVLWTDSQSNLHFLPCVIAERFSNDAMAAAMVEVFAEAIGARNPEPVPQAADAV